MTGMVFFDEKGGASMAKAAADRRDARRRRLPAANFRPAGVKLAVLPPAERISLRAPAASVAALSKALGVDLPQKPKTSAAEGRAQRRCGSARTSGWSSTRPARTRWPIAPSVNALHSAVGISHRNVAIVGHRTGRRGGASMPAARRICRLRPFRSAPARAPSSARSRSCCCARRKTRFRVECWRSFSDYVWTFLTEAARDAAA